MMIDDGLLDILRCPLCRQGLKTEPAGLRCLNASCARLYPVDDGIPVMLADNRLERELGLTRDKWMQNYSLAPEKVSIEGDICLQDSDRFLRRFISLENGGLYLEAGCGMAKNALLLCRGGLKVVGVDICLNALKKAKAIFESEGRKGYFICADMNFLPLKDNLFDYVYAGGSLEHFPDTQRAAGELNRVLAPCGRLISTVPVISLSTLTYGQLSGNIPDLPVLRQLAEFFQIKLLRKKFMVYGYEKSFTAGKVIRILRRAGFTDIEWGPYHTHWEIKFFKSQAVKSLLRRLTRLRAFWPFIYATAKKA